MSPEYLSWLRTTGQAFEVVRELLGDALRSNGTGESSSHPVWRVGYRPDFNLDSIKATLCNRLDTIGCQFVTTNEQSINTEAETLCYFAVAPFIFERATAVYHATPTRLIPVILSEGLLPSSDSRSLTRYPDTIGKIHASLTLTKEPDKGDPATWWQEHLAKRYGEPFSVLAVDLSELPPGARIYRDTHSHWGIVIDHVERIPPHSLREVETTFPASPST